MSLKILGGMAKSYPLATPRVETTRPTAVMIKRKLFDWRQHLDDHVFVDLCAGSGAMGFEALSRGARRVFLNELTRPAFHILKDNKANLERAFGFEPSQITVTNLDVKAWVQRELTYQLPDTVAAFFYRDPPYENHALFTDVLRLLREAGFRGELWLESDRLKGPKRDDLTGAFQTVIKTVEQGDHFVVVGKLV
jgi:16S rRNA (guanine966-N2)-methyltransferase